MPEPTQQPPADSGPDITAGSAGGPTDPAAVLSQLEASAAPGGKRAKLSQQAADDAMAWIMEDPPPPDQQVRATRDLNVDVGIDTPRRVQMTIGSIAQSDISDAREKATQRVGRKSPVISASEIETRIQCRIIAAGLVHPDLEPVRESFRKRAKEAGAKPAEQEPPEGFESEWVRAKLSGKPGIIAALVGQVYDLSGFSDDAVLPAGE